MGMELSGIEGGCESIIVSDNPGPTEELLNGLETQIEYQLKSYLSAKDPKYNTLIHPGHAMSAFDARLLQKLITKSKSTQIFAFQLIHEIFADRFKLKYQNPFITYDEIIDNHLIIKDNKFVIQSIDNTGSQKRKSQKLAWTVNYSSINDTHDTVMTTKPKTERELIASIESAIHFKYKINVISKCKPSDCNKYGNNKVLNIDLSELNTAQIAIDYNTLNLHGKSICNLKNMIHSESGSTPDQIHSVLWPKQKRDRLSDSKGTFKVLSCVYDHKFDNLCIYDIISNGLQSSISSPFNNKSLINSVKSFRMIIIDQVPSKHKLFTLSRIVQIEPSVGSGAIHDKFKWEQRYPDIELIQNTEIFESCLSGFGLFGIIYSYHLLIQDAYFLRKNVCITNWADFKQQRWETIQKECKSGNILGVNLMISPYCTMDNKYLLSPPMTISIYRKTKIRNPNNIRFHCNVDSNKDEKRKKYSTLLHTNSAILIWISKVFPSLIPFLLQMMLQQSRISLQEDIENINAPFKSNEFGLMFDNFIDAVDEYIKLLNEMKKSQNNKQFVTAPFIVRFGKKCTGNLNFNAKHKWNVFIKQPMAYFDIKLKETDNNKTLMTPYLFDILKRSQSLFRKYHSSINLGLYYDDTNNDLLTKSINKTKLTKFVESYQKFNISKIFCNAFTTKLCLDKMCELHTTNGKAHRKKKNSPPPKARVIGNSRGSAQILSL